MLILCTVYAPSATSAVWGYCVGRAPSPAFAQTSLGAQTTRPLVIPSRFSGEESAVAFPEEPADSSDLKVLGMTDD